jgi:hypothetical protein
MWRIQRKMRPYNREDMHDEGIVQGRREDREVELAQYEVRLRR